MRFVFVGAGAVGGFYAALLARKGLDVGVVARGAHLDAIRRGGIRVESEAVGSFSVPVAAERDPARFGPADVVVLAVKTYSNAGALPLVLPLLGPDTTVLTLQNGVDSAEEVAAAVGEVRTIAGATYVATGIEAPGVIRHTGSYRRIVMGECFGTEAAVSERVQRVAEAMSGADIEMETVPDARVSLWEKFIYLAPFAAITAASRQPIGPIWADADGRETFLAAVGETEAVARATGIAVAPDIFQRVERHTASLPPDVRSSMLIDLTHGKPLELDSLPGSVVRRGRAAGVPTPRMQTMLAVLRPFAAGATSQK
jgi:2-dehydropantoate 2-reductase